MKTYVNAYLDDTAVTRIDGSNASIMIAFGYPPYPLYRVFKDAEIDGVFIIDQPTSTPLLSGDQVAYGYRELVPVTPSTIDKQNVYGPKLRWQMSAELRRIGETYPTGSLRLHSVERPSQRRLGSHTLYQQTHIWEYVRDTT